MTRQPERCRFTQTSQFTREMSQVCNKSARCTPVARAIRRGYISMKTSKMDTMPPTNHTLRTLNESLYMTKPSLLCLAAFLLASCSVGDSKVAARAQTQLIGLSEVDLQSCLGVPDQHSSFGSTNILTYYATSTSNSSFSIPVVGGVGFGNGGYCHATFQLVDGHVKQILYSGETNAAFAPNAYCAPILRTCLHHLAQMPAPASSPDHP